MFCTHRVHKKTTNQITMVLNKRIEMLQVFWNGRKRQRVATCKYSETKWVDSIGDSKPKPYRAPYKDYKAQWQFKTTPSVDNSIILVARLSHYHSNKSKHLQFSIKQRIIQPNQSHTMLNYSISRNICWEFKQPHQFFPGKVVNVFPRKTWHLFSSIL